MRYWDYNVLKQAPFSPPYFRDATFNRTETFLRVLNIVCDESFYFGFLVSIASHIKKLEYKGYPRKRFSSLGRIL
jgi:hypothetical protein